jgi:hypothetical protein
LIQAAAAGGGSRTVGHRLYALLTESEFRVATAVSADE